MYLKDLTLRGFKSFASTTTLQFEPGITAIVGPNGSGKSNVVDALAWVMGEQGAKSLRGANMADVIFAGAADRAALGRAQVDLTIDNSDGKLPIPYSEVTITRTMFRSGGSEYAINGQKVRLLDVQELLSDTGMGRQMHVIVGQGMLDSVLSATPEERRSFIDEAAGVAKYRKRKSRAVSKLAGMDRNLVRVLDLTDELKRGLAPLRRAARAARQAAGTQALLAYADARLIGDDGAAATERLQSEKNRLAGLRGGSEGARQQLESLRESIRQLRTQVEDTLGQVGAAQEVYRDLVAQRDRFASIAELAEEKKRHAGAVTIAISDDAIQHAERVSEAAEEEAEQLNAAAKEARGQFHQAVTKREESQAALRLLQRKTSEAFAAHQQVLESHARAERKASSARERVAEATRELQGAKQRLQDAQSRLEELRADAQHKPGPAVGVEPGEEASRFDAATVAEEQLQEELAAARQTESILAGDLSALEAEIEALQRSIDSRRAGGKEPAAASFTPGRKGRLGDHLVVAPGWEEAVQALLGSLLDAWLVADRADLVRLSEHLPADLDAKQAGASGYVSGAKTAPPQETVGVEGVQAAASVVQGRGAAADAVAALLHNHFVAEDNEAALKAADSLREDAVVATRGGSLIGRQSVLLRPGPETSTLVLRAEIEAATARLTATRQQADDARFAAADLTERLSAARAERADALRALRAADAERAEEEKEAARLSALLHAASSEVQRFEGQVETSEANLSELEDVLRRTQAELPDEAPPEESAGQQEAEEAERAEAKRLELARDVENEARMAAHIGEERAAAALRQAKQQQTQVKTLVEGRREQEARQRKAQRTRSAVSEVVEQALAASGRAGQAARRASEVRDALDEKRASLHARMEQLSGTLTEEERRSASLGEALLQTEVVHAQAEARVEQVRQRAEALLGEYGPLLRDREDEDADALSFFMATYGPHLPWAPPAEGEDQPTEPPSPYRRPQAEETYEAAKRKLARLGVVNPLAVEEYEAAKERLDYLTSQVDDINESKTHLLRLIDQIDEQVQLAFEEAFTDTADQFEQTFGELFPGGKGRLELTEPEDPLTTGVEIYARPAGKRVTRLSLLSGGERSLAALAYLIAIFRARPSPFYVLDEVEAALDDVNLTRVLNLFEQLRENSQLLVVTHQKRTMEEADALYGVSMRDGVSKVISHKMG